MSRSLNAGVPSSRRHSGGRDRALVDAVTTWFHANARELPWRINRNGYTALVAEAMLQQTQVARVLEHYDRFLTRFPTIAALAQADEQSVLAQWQGLGYYRRARHLHAAAKCIVNEHNGLIPTSPGGLRKLPGVGRYTAGAIASIVFGERTPIVDGNVQRVLARWDARQETESPREREKWAWTRAEEMVAHATEPGGPGGFNEGLMELGAMICTPASPRCNECPVARWCEAKRQGIANEIPAAKAAAPRRTVHHHAVLVKRGEKLLFVQRPARGLWANMWQTPTVEAESKLTDARIIDALALPIVSIAEAGEFTHQTTHRRVDFHVYTTRTRVRKGVWRTRDDVADLPLSNAHRRVLTYADR